MPGTAHQLLFGMGNGPGRGRGAGDAKKCPGVVQQEGVAGTGCRGHVRRWWKQDPELPAV